MLKILLYLLLFFLPTQLGKHFWFEFSDKLGMRIDYLSPTLYFTDLIIIFIFIFWVIKGSEAQSSKLKVQSYSLNFKNFVNSVAVYKWRFISGVLLLVFCYWWLFVVGENFWLLLYNLIKLAEMALLAYIIAKTFDPNDFPQIIKVLNWALILQVSLAAYQVLTSQSSGLWILGERTFTIGSPAIAKLLTPNGILLLRGYGTFPHPNLLAGFSLMLLGANSIIFLSGRKFQKTSSKFQITPNKQNSKSENDLESVTWNLEFYLIGFIFSLLGVWLSMSLLAIALALMLLVICWGSGRNIMRPHILSLLTLMLILVSGIWYLGFFNSDSLDRRLNLLKISLQIFKTSPIFGIGLGNFIPMMPDQPLGRTYFFQPVHNCPVLLLVETGLAGMATIGFFIYLGLKKFKVQNLKFKITNQNAKFLRFQSAINYQKLTIINWWLIILVTGMFDHYWLTLQQGRLMLVLVIGLGMIFVSGD
jgi:hypothetical protein